MPYVRQEMNTENCVCQTTLNPHTILWQTPSSITWMRYSCTELVCALGWPSSWMQALLTLHLCGVPETIQSIASWKRMTVSPEHVCPHKYRSLWKSHRVCHSAKCLIYTGEGLDFKMEEVNKGVQHCISGVPSVPVPTTVNCRTSDQVCLLMLMLKTPRPQDQESPPTKIADQGTEVRTLVRMNQFLSSPCNASDQEVQAHAGNSGQIPPGDPARIHRDATEDSAERVLQQSPGLTSLSGQLLDSDLCQLSNLAFEKRGLFIDALLQWSSRSCFWSNLQVASCLRYSRGTTTIWTHF